MSDEPISVPSFTMEHFQKGGNPRAALVLTGTQHVDHIPRVGWVVEMDEADWVALARKIVERADSEHWCSYDNAIMALADSAAGFAEQDLEARIDVMLVAKMYDLTEKQVADDVRGEWA